MGKSATMGVAIGALLAFGTLAAPAQAAVVTYNFTGRITSSTNSLNPTPIDPYAGTSFTGQFSYDSNTAPSSSSGFQDIYYNAVTISFSSLAGNASGTGYINWLHGYFGNEDSFSYGVFTSGDYYLVNIGTRLPLSTTGSPLPTDLSGKTFAFGAEGFVVPGLDARKTLEGTFTLDAPAAVPEPAAWALLIGGFGLIGGTLRGRARQVSFAA